MLKCLCQWPGGTTGKGLPHTRARNTKAKEEVTDTGWFVLVEVGFSCA